KPETYFLDFSARLKSCPFKSYLPRKSLVLVHNTKMVIYFLRHANAGTKHFSNPARDEKRPIDKLGEEQSHDVGRAMAAIGVTANVIISSPMTRAIQTANIVAQELGHE